MWGTYPLCSAVLLELGVLHPARLGGLLLVLERIHNFVCVQAAKEAVARFPAALSLRAGGGDDAGADFGRALLVFGLPEETEEAHFGRAGGSDRGRRRKL